MLSVYLDTSPLRRRIADSLGSFSERAYYSAVAPLRVRRISSPALPGGSWVRVRNRIAGISERDVSQVRLITSPQVSVAAAPRQRRQYLGSEVVGEVVETGPDVQFLQRGDRVAYQFGQHCATRDIEPPCRYCAVGNFNLCENRYLPDYPTVGGGWSEEMIVHERQLFLVPDGVSDEQAALLEPAAICVHAVLRRHPQHGDQVLIIGTGALGQLTIQTVRALAPNAHIAALPTHPYQVEMSQRMGAAHTLYPEEGTAGVARLTGAKRYRRHAAELLAGGFDVIFDTLGTEESLQNALRWVRASGTVVLVANEPRMQHLDLTPVWHHETTLLGAVGHGTETWPPDGGGRIATFTLAATLVRERRLTPERLVTHRFPLREVRRALMTAHYDERHQTLQVLLDIQRNSALPISHLETASHGAVRYGP
jgi:threonine dehydrogenase-like Zn-dependent dehydrogenase